MAITAEQTLFDLRGLEETVYSGNVNKWSDIVARYSQDITQVSRSLDDAPSEEGETFASRKLNKGTTRTYYSDGLLSDLSTVDERGYQKPKLPKKNTSTLTPTQEWEGFVELIKETKFVVRLTNVKDATGSPTEAAEFEMRELPYADQKRLEIGSLVRWVVGFERLPNDQRQRVSRLHMRRLPVFTSKDIERAYADADDLLEGLTWDDAS
ncbi:hypothetical protein SAMN05444339_101152 [Loktanella atrilutea]|uniref:Uncharacterized protein n=2 Tax=Loktanella atrilutea TaxID=366533 RepID=A0A1M4SV90_LOKAT|nr:hypothetical protein SAMN05444339_101152 [Loktanella atrilutea]